MGYYFSVSEDGYVLSVSTVGTGNYLSSIDEFDLSGDRMRFHKWNGTSLEFDEDAYSQYVVTKHGSQSSVEVSQLDRIEAQVTYTALKTGTLIGE